MRNFTAAFPGSFDPFHLGHLDIVKKFLAMHPSFELVIVIGVNPDKSGALSLEERQDVIQKTVPEELHDRLSILATSGIIADTLSELKVNTFIKGVRNKDDFEYELRIARFNAMLGDNPDTMFIPQTNQDFLYASSSDIKQMIMLGIDTSQYVPPFTEEKLKQVLL